jgi:F-type H+-transporting ATPase subunit alpha
MSQRPELASAALRSALDQTARALRSASDARTALEPREVGYVARVGAGIVRVRGLPGVAAEELIELSGGVLAMVLDLEPGEIGAIVLGAAEGVQAGSAVRRTHRVADAPVGTELLGRIVDAVGRPLDGGTSLDGLARLPIERPAPPISARAPVSAPLHTGIKVVDSLLPIGRGQR